jgi:hypothetical protein
MVFTFDRSRIVLNVGPLCWRFSGHTAPTGLLVRAMAFTIRSHKTVFWFSMSNNTSILSRVWSETRQDLDWWSDLLDSLMQLVTALHKSLSHTDKCSQPRSSLRCLVAASNGRHSPSSGFPNCPRPQLPASNSNCSHRLNCNSSLTHLLTHSPTNYFGRAIAQAVSRWLPTAGARVRARVR